MTETLTPSTKIRSNTIYRIEHEITGTINVANVRDVTFEGGTLIGGYNLTGVNNGITWADQEIQATNIGVQIRSDGSKIEFYNCDLHGGNYGTWIRPASGGYVSGLLFDGCQVHSTRDDSVYVYKAHRFTFKNGLIHHSNLNWKAPETSQKVAAGDGMQLILCDRVSIEGNTIDRSQPVTSSALSFQVRQDRITPRKYRITLSRSITILSFSRLRPLRVGPGCTLVTYHQTLSPSLHLTS